MPDFESRLKALVKAKRTFGVNMTQAKIAADLAITPQALSYYLNGREPDYKTLIRIADYFNVSCDYILGKSEYRNAAEVSALESQFGRLPQNFKNQCIQVQQALAQVGDSYQSLSIWNREELLNALIDDLLIYISAYQHIADDNTPECNLGNDPFYFINQFVYATSQAQQNLAKVVYCLAARGNIIASSVLHKHSKSKHQNEEGVSNGQHHAEDE